MKYFKRFVLMVQFLTTIPVPAKLDVTGEDFGKGLVFAPFIGFLLGGLLAASYLAVSCVFPQPVAAVLVLVLYILLTGGLHLDGLGDTFDGLFSNRPKEKMLEIMRDSRVGTNAVLAVTCLLLLDWSLLSYMDGAALPKAILLFPVAGRIGSLVGAGVSTYARSGEGLGKSFIDHCGLSQAAAGTAAYMLIFLAASGPWGLLAGLLPPLTAFGLTRLFSKKIGGATGDILGAVCELNQAFFLMEVFILARLML